MITVEGGSVKRLKEPYEYRVAVEKIEFESGVRKADGTIDDCGKGAYVTTKWGPKEPYKVKEKIEYYTGNNNDTRVFKVTSVIGSAKYKVK